ncbi:MAG: outer membrane channel protein TolC [Gammaproteobacteria bacterium]|nr:MAG: outer membrane channel protein TolC [Gammaproteobacteria bacterium]
MTFRSLWITGLLLASGSAQPVDLVTVYQEAIQANPQLAAAAANLRAVREKRPQAMADLLPALDASGSLDTTRQEDLDNSNSTDNTTNKLASLDLVQPLFRYDRWIKLQQTDSTIAGAEATYAAAQQNLMVQVSERYFDVLEAQDSLEYSKSEKSAIGRQLEQMTQKFELGLIANTDVKAAQARYDISISDEIQALSQLVGSKDSLRRVVGTYHEQLVPLKADLQLVRPEPDSLETWIESAKRQNVTILATQAARESARQEMRIQRAGHLPTLDLTANASYFDREFGGVLSQERFDSGIGLKANLPLYHGGAISSRTREARIRFDEATNLLEDQILTVELDTRNAFRGIETDIALVKALGKTLESTEVAVKSEEAGFAAGTRTIVDVLNAQRENYLARFKYARARYQYVIHQLQLKKAAGTLSGDDLIEVNSKLSSNIR